MHTSPTAVARAMPAKIAMKFPLAFTLTLGVMLMVISAGHAQASSNANFATEAVTKNKARKLKTKPKPDKGYGETIAERDRRLLRECKGRPNAGACEGYAH
jgi:hypothetical protein